MRPTLFTWTGRSIDSYRAMLMLAVVIYYILGVILASIQGLPVVPFAAAASILAISALIGAQFLYVLSHLPHYKRQPQHLWKSREGGAALFGGLVASLLASVPTCALLGLPLARFLDVVTMAALPAVAIGRVGCLLHGCCAGRVTSSFIGLRLKVGLGTAVPRFPVPLLDIALVVGVLAILLIGETWHLREGMRFLLGCFCYASGRFILDFLRDQAATKLRVTHSQIIALTLCIFSAYFIVTIPS